VRCIRWVGRVEGWDHADRWETDLTFVGKTKGWIGNSYSDFNLRPLRGTFEEIVTQVVAYRLAAA
jgi:hypothetical protein